MSGVLVADTVAVGFSSTFYRVTAVSSIGGGGGFVVGKANGGTPKKEDAGNASEVAWLEFGSTSEVDELLSHGHTLRFLVRKIYSLVSAFRQNS